MRNTSKRTLALALALMMVLGLAAASPAMADAKQTINLYTFTDEVPNMIARYMELNPDFAAKYDVVPTIVATTDGAYQPALDAALQAGGSSAPDIYCAEAAFVLKYTQGDMASYAASYKDLGIDVDALLAEAQIAPYTIDIGTRPSDSALVGLGYQATGGAFIYRRSIAKDTWGTDDPATITSKIGPGWDTFWGAAAELQAKGYAIVSGDGDIWHAVENASENGWIVDDTLSVAPAREAFLDMSKNLTDNGWSHQTTDWQDAWFADMKGNGTVFGFFGPAWLINYVMAGNSGAGADAVPVTFADDPAASSYGDWAVCEPPVGFYWGGTWVIGNKDSQAKEGVAELIQWITLDSSDTGLQYFWANGTLNGSGGTKDTVASATVMANSDGTLDFLGGQNMFDAFGPAGAFATGKNATQYDESINNIWRDQVRMYASGQQTKEESLANFKQLVSDQLGIPAA